MYLVLYVLLGIRFNIIFKIRKECDPIMVTTAEEIFRKGTIEQQADLLCDIFLMNDALTCEECPAAKTCRPHHSGFIDWLKKERWFREKEERKSG